MNLTNEQIKEEFKKQVRLCGGIGRKEMLSIIDEDDFVGINNLGKSDVIRWAFEAGFEYANDIIGMGADGDVNTAFEAYLQKTCG